MLRGTGVAATFFSGEGRMQTTPPQTMWMFFLWMHHPSARRSPSHGPPLSLRALQSLKAAPGYRAQHYSLGLTGMEQGGGGEGGLQPAFTSDVSGSPCSSSIGIVNISSVDKGEGAPPEVGGVGWSGGWLRGA